MNKLKYGCIALLACMASMQAQAATCPDPNTSALQWGNIPAPWVINPFSDNVPQAESNTKFKRANILIAGIGRGVVCTYQNSIGYYSIWWQVNVKIPARTENSWYNSSAGFQCSEALEACVFYPG